MRYIITLSIFIPAKRLLNEPQPQADPANAGNDFNHFNIRRYNDAIHDVYDSRRLSRRKRKRVEGDFTPPADLVEPMMKYNEELAKAGALIALDGLHPIQKGARVAFSKGKATVTDGPFIESKEVFGGYWMVQFKSKEEAIEWARRVPAQDGDVIEIRQVFELEDFPADVQKAADSPTVKAAIEKRK